MKLQEFIEENLVPIAEKIGSNKYLIALRDGFVYAVPFLIVGSFVLFLVNLPFRDPNNFLYQVWYDNLMIKYKADLVQPYYVSMGIMSIFVSFGIAYSLASSYKLSGITSGFLSLFTFLILAGQSDWIPLGGETAKFGIEPGGWFPVLDARYFDAKGIFTATIGAFFSVELYRFLVEKKITIKLPDSVPPSVAKSFEALIPVILIAIIVQALNIFSQNVAGILLPEFLMNIFRPLVHVSDTLIGTLIIVFIVHILWFFGLHGQNVILALFNPIVLTNLQTNMDSLQNNLPLPHVLAGGFLDAFVYLGGSGATLGLAIAMILSKSAHLKAIGKLAFVPSIFNINEPITFGSPIVLNPVLGIPFVIVPLVLTTIAYTLTSIGFISRISALVPWTTPAPLAALIATNLDAKALILSLMLILLATLIYLPFLRTYDKVLLNQEKIV